MGYSMNRNYYIEFSKKIYEIDSGMIRRPLTVLYFMAVLLVLLFLLVVIFILSIRDAFVYWLDMWPELFAEMDFPELWGRLCKMWRGNRVTD